MSEECRSPYGERGLKSVWLVTMILLLLSLSLRRAWIEIQVDRVLLPCGGCRSPYGERGLKSRPR